MATEISVVVPTYNRCALLRATLDCILDQTLPAAEIIVVDDSSTDDTGSLVHSYADRGIRYIRIPNSGPLAARNVGLRHARSDLVAFCDSDDLWRSKFLETAAALWAAAPSLAVSYANFSIVRAGSWDGRTKFADAPPGFWTGLRHLAPGLGILDQPFADRLIDFQPFFPTGMIVRRDAFLAGGGWDEGVSRILGCDFATALRAAENPPVGIVEAPLVGIRKHEGNISGDAERTNLGNARILEHVLATRPALRRHERHIRASIAARRRAALDAAFVRHDLGAVRDIFSLLPSHERRPLTRLRRSVAAAPAPLASLLTDAALMLGTSRARLTERAAARLHAWRRIRLAWSLAHDSELQELS